MPENWGSDIDKTINLRIYKVSKGVAFCLYYKFNIFIFGKDHDHIVYLTLGLTFYSLSTCGNKGPAYPQTWLAYCYWEKQ